MTRDCADRTFRFDDVCINADMELLHQMAEYLYNRFTGCEVIWAISPIVEDDCGQRVFDKLNNAYSDFSVFYLNARTMGIPLIKEPRITKAAHGLLHIDHRLLDYGAQEMSIVTSCSLTGADIFVPPFSKWNKDTIDVCQKHNISLIRFEEGWRCGEHELYYDTLRKLYFHSREWTLDNFKNYFDGL